MKVLSILLLFFIPFLNLNPEEEIIPWSEDYRLQWCDFKGKQRTGVSYVASTTSGISFSYSISKKNGNKILKTTVISNFYPESSWVNPKNATPYILAHEQAHFDISEIHARILKKEISETIFSKKIKKELSSLYKSVEKRRVAMQHQFDSESDHSKNKEEEYRWEVTIKQQLEEYERWK